MDSQLNPFELTENVMMNTYDFPNREYEHMVTYNLEHLTQEDRQEVSGPIQDDEALFMFAIIRGMQIETVLEIGGLNGYSARNFLAAVGQEGTVFTCDVNPVAQIANNHVVLIKNGIELDPSDFKQSKIELLFFDCHDYDVQMKILSNLQKNKMLADRVVLVLHDTNTHPYQSVSWAFETTDGYVHQVVERQMVNDLVADGWHAFSLHTDSKKLLRNIPYRHGVTVLTKFVKFDNGIDDSAVSGPRKRKYGFKFFGHQHSE